MVQVQTSASSSNLWTYSVANDTTSINSTANVYFLEEDSDSKYRVFFGDDTVGRALTTGNIILLKSKIADATAPNGAKTFTPTGTVGGYSNVTVSTISAASGGANRDSVSSIKFNAPRQYQAQNRAVTINDYIRIVQRDYSDAESGRTCHATELSSKKQKDARRNNRKARRACDLTCGDEVERLTTSYGALVNDQGYWN